jgi:hypothetical protein
MDITFPLFALEKNDGSMCLIEDRDRILYHLEAIDIENKEYVFWDLNGEGVSIAVARGRIASMTKSAPELTLRDALVSYAKHVGVPKTAQTGTPMDIWQRITATLESRRTKRSWMSRLTSSGRTKK